MVSGLTLQTYYKIKLLYNGIIAIEFSENPNLQVGNIYHHSPTIKSIIRKVNFYDDYEGKKYSIITELL